MKFDVFLPSLLVSPSIFAESSPPRLPALETLLARGIVDRGSPWPEALLSAFDVESIERSTGIAAFSALGEGIETASRGWMYAEPAHFQTDRDSLNLIPASHLDIAAAEAAQLTAALNANFADRGLIFFAGTSGHWYVSCSADVLPKTTPIRTARRGALFEKMPQSKGLLSWKAIQNEAQMLLFSHPVNEAREVNGRLTVNGLWFWGEGELPAPIRGPDPTLAVFGDTSIAAGLAKWANATFLSLTEIDVTKAEIGSNRSIVVIESLEIPHERGDVHQWREAILRLELQIFGPLLSRLRAGTIEEVTLTLPREYDSIIVKINGNSVRGLAGLWNGLIRRPRPFLEFSLA